MSGFTPTQAERLHHAIDHDMARAEDAIVSMLRRVSDHDLRGAAEAELEDLRIIAGQLKTIVDRRRR